jgi:apolipoprotein D and lipocalin family protein
MKSTQIKTVDEVDINRFMGDWYVLAHIPSYVEKNAFNAVESYKLNEDGSIATTFTFNEGSLALLTIGKLNKNEAYKLFLRSF